MALQLQRTKIVWGGCCLIAVQGGLLVSIAPSLNFNFDFLSRISLLLNELATLLSSRGWVDPFKTIYIQKMFKGIAKIGISWMAVRRANH